jgi:hypothetical protein
VLLENSGDGETLRVRQQAWEDPFAEPLTEENRAFVAESGKWAAFDTPAQDLLGMFIGDVLTGVEPVSARPGKITGIILRTGGGGIIRVDVEADELFLNQVIPSAGTYGNDTTEGVDDGRLGHRSVPSRRPRPRSAPAGSEPIPPA